jgi:hypothetical protein
MTFHCTIQRVLLALSFLVTLLIQWYNRSLPSVTEIATHSADPVNPEIAPITSSNKTYHALPRVLFHSAGVDRSGSIIFDMLMVHAYAYQRNFTYGGACFSDPTPEDQQFLPEHEALIALLGLSHVLRFTCPSPSGHWVDRNTVLASPGGTRIWTPEWRAYIQSMRSPPSPPRHNASSRPQMVVHMRRGDVDLCDPVVAFRYLPQAHYRQLIQEFREKDMEVSVYSESNSTEPWDDDFRSGVDHLYLDTPLVEAWRAMLTADVLILSTSGFSNVPAVFNLHGRVIYTPFWEQPLPHWHVVGNATMERLCDTKAQLAQELCG